MNLLKFSQRLSEQVHDANQRHGDAMLAKMINDNSSATYEAGAKYCTNQTALFAALEAAKTIPSTIGTLINSWLADSNISRDREAKYQAKKAARQAIPQPPESKHIKPAFELISYTADSINQTIKPYSALICTSQTAPTPPPFALSFN